MIIGPKQVLDLTTQDSHPGDWEQSGYREIQKAPKRYAIIDLAILSGLNGFTDVRDFQPAHRRWVEQTLESGHTVHDDRWSEAIAVGSLAFVANVKGELGSKALHRTVEHRDGAYALREPGDAYNGDFGKENRAVRMLKSSWTRYFARACHDSAGTWE